MANPVLDLYRATRAAEEAARVKAAKAYLEALGYQVLPPKAEDEVATVAEEAPAPAEDPAEAPVEEAAPAPAEDPAPAPRKRSRKPRV